MKKSKLKSLMILSLAGLLVACAPSSNTFTIGSDVPYGLAGRKARREYNALLATSVTNLNYLETQEAQDAQHFANFIDGLLLHNDFGVLEKNLATKVETNADYTEFVFTVRENVPWVRYDGTQYKATINGVATPQFVEPQDWVTTAKAISTHSNASGLQYLIGMFVRGAEEYYHWSMIEAYAAEGKNPYARWNNDQKAAEINKLIQENAPTVYEAVYADNPLTGDDIPAIANMSRFGVKADAEARTVTYTLNSSASYFPTLFTYSCYLPTNEHFLKETRFTPFGTTNDKILYNGPYLLDSYDETQVTYVANPTYWNSQANGGDVIVLDKVNYIVAPSSIGNDYTRNEFESGRIDGFSVNSNDGTGWKKYITGPDGSGTIQNPYSEYVNSRLLDTIGNMYGSNIVMARDADSSRQTSYVTGATAETVRNTARALSITEVREAVLASFDYPLYFERYGVEKILQTQQLVHTYVPTGFVLDDDGNDYVKGQYYNTYAEKEGITYDEAAEILAPGQYDSRIVEQDDLDVIIQKAKDAIELYNADPEHEDITLPFNLEYYSLAFDEETAVYDTEYVTSMNKRLNGGNEGAATFAKVLMTDKVESSNYEAVSRSGHWDFSVVQWGWGADYGDPLTFMNTYRKGNGDWADVFPFVGDDYVANHTVVDGELVETDLLAAYTELVDEGAKETEDINARYEKFAEAEYMLIEELQFYKPQVNNGQGWSVSVSRAAGYFSPTASFGLANDRLTGLYVLENVLTREERQAAREAQEAAKAAYLAEHGSINIYD